MEYIVFYNYANGAREFSFYTDFKEANTRYHSALKTAGECGSKVEIGIAEIVDVHKVS